jgi:hypothetical protein
MNKEHLRTIKDPAVESNISLEQVQEVIRQVQEEEIGVASDKSEKPAPQGGSENSVSPKGQSFTT